MSQTNSITIIAAQINLLVGDIYGNAARIIEESRRAETEYQADLIAFPELSISSYPPEDLLFRPAFHNHCEHALNQICSETANLNITLIVGHPFINEQKLYNMVSVIQKGIIIARYAKQELPNYTVFDEKRYFSPGATPCIITIKNISMGILICEDAWHPGPALQAVTAGAELIISINASPFDRNQAHTRESILSQRCHEIHVPLIYVNLVGGQDELVFDGGSLALNAEGQCCQRAAFFKEELMPIQVYLSDSSSIITENVVVPPKSKVIIKPQPIPHILCEEENIYNALVLGIRDYIKKNHFPGAIIGLSGGIDSALMLALAVDAIGAEKVLAVSMPSPFTRQISIDDAVEQCEQLKVNYHIIQIDNIFQAYLDDLSKIFMGHKTDTTEENLQARIRGTLLMALSNKFGSIVLSTGNKSEMAIGYSTLYGDMVGGFSALKDIPKTLVYRLAHYRNKNFLAIPHRVLERAPSAELAYEQLDQDTLPPYSILDQIIYHYIELEQSLDDICALGIDKETVHRVVKMINRNEYKRRQAPIGIRTTKKAFGKDRRYPITSAYF